MDEAMAWFDHYLKGLPLKRYPNVEVQDNEGKWRTERAWPPADARPYALPLRPGGYVDNGGNDASAPVSGTWTFSQPAPYDAHFAGEPRLTVEIDTDLPNARVIGLLYDVDHSGNARLISRGAYLVPESGKASY